MTRTGLRGWGVATGGVAGGGITTPGGGMTGSVATGGNITGGVVLRGSSKSADGGVAVKTGGVATGV